MSQTTDQRRFASLYVTLTGEETITEPQHDDAGRRLQDDTDRDVADYVAHTAREHGLDDAIDTADEALAD